MAKRKTPRPNDPADSQFSVHPDSGDAAAWEEIEAGRFMPRRVRGSNRGRALG